MAVIAFLDVTAFRRAVTRTMATAVAGGLQMTSRRCCVGRTNTATIVAVATIMKLFWTRSTSHGPISFLPQWWPSSIKLVAVQDEFRRVRAARVAFCSAFGMGPRCRPMLEFDELLTHGPFAGSESVRCVSCWDS